MVYINGIYQKHKTGLIMKNPILQQLPLGISIFSEIRNEGYLYVDKTEDIYNLITRGRRYFLSRPRRFGKSLLVSTLEEILAGNKSLFEGLWIDNSDYTWQPYGVISLDFSKFDIENIDIFKSELLSALFDISRSYGIAEPMQAISPGHILGYLVEELYKKFGKVAI